MNENTHSDTPLGKAHTPRGDVQAQAWRRYRVRFALSEPFVWLEAQRRLHDRLDILTLKPLQILDAAPRAGTGALALATRYPLAMVAAHCPSRFATLMLKGKYTGNFIQRLINGWRGKPQARIAWLPVVPAVQYDLIVCNLALSWSMNPPEQLEFWSQQLAPGGVLLFSALGPDTAKSFRAAAQQAGWVTPTGSDFVDMHDYGDMMVQAGLSNPVMDVERLQLTYQDAQKMRLDTAGLMGNLHPQRLAGLGGKARFKALESVLNAQAPMPLELELVFGHAFKPLPTARKKAKDPAAQTVSLDSLKASLPSHQAPG